MIAVKLFVTLIYYLLELEQHYLITVNFYILNLLCL